MTLSLTDALAAVEAALVHATPVSVVTLCGEEFETETDARSHTMTCGECAGLADGPQ